MRSWRRRMMMMGGALAAGGFVLSGPGTSCSSFAGESLLVTADFCFIFDCQNGALGGTITPCSGIGSGSGTVEGVTQPSLFTDCPVGNAGP